MTEGKDEYVIISETAAGQLVWLCPDNAKDQYRWKDSKIHVARFPSVLEAETAVQKWWTLRCIMVARTYGEEFKDTAAVGIYNRSRVAIAMYNSETYWL